MRDRYTYSHGIMIDETLQPPQTPRSNPRQWPITLLVLLLLLIALILVVLQALRRCGDGQLQWGDLGPLALPAGLLLFGLVTLIVRMILIARRPKDETPKRRYGM